MCDEPKCLFVVAFLNLIIVWVGIGECQSDNVSFSLHYQSSREAEAFLKTNKKPNCAYAKYKKQKTATPSF